MSNQTPVMVNALANLGNLATEINASAEGMLLPSENSKYTVNMVSKLAYFVQGVNEGKPNFEERLVKLLRRLYVAYPNIAVLPPNLFTALSKANGCLKVKGYKFEASDDLLVFGIKSITK